MPDSEESREDWERELVDLQRGITPAEGLRRSQILTKKLSATPAPIVDLAHLLKFLFGVVFFVISFLAFSSGIRYGSAFAGLAFIVGCYLAIAAVQGHRKV
jgi:hypothetical protein